MTRRWFYPHAEVLHIVDGDTIDVEITWDVGFGVEASTTQRLRLARINTPETNRTAEKPAGQAAEAYLRTIIHERHADHFERNTHRPGSVIAVETFKDDAFGRYLADIWTDPNDIGSDDTLNDQLADAGHAEYKTYGQTPGVPRANSAAHMTVEKQLALLDQLGIEVTDA